MKEICQDCGKEIRGRDSVQLTVKSGEAGRSLCLACYNRFMAERMGIEFHHPDFEPMELVDADETKRRFYFATRLLGDKLAIEAYEESFEGYDFEVLGHALDEPMALFRDLVGKMRRTLALKHLDYEEGRLHIGREGIVRGRINWDEETDGELPLLVIDGRPVTWHEFGRMLMTFEGWQFRLEIVDRSGEP